MRLQESNREIADDFLEYLNHRGLLQTQLIWDRNDLGIHFQTFRVQRRCQGLKTISFSKSLYALARIRRKELQVQNGNTVIFRGSEGFSRSSFNTTTKSVLNQAEPARTFESDYIKFTPISEHTSSTKPGYFRRKLTTKSTEFSVIELEVTNKSPHYVSLKSGKILRQSREFRIEPCQDISLPPSCKMNISVHSIQEADVCGTELEITLVVNQEIQEYVIVHLTYEVVDENDLSELDSEQHNPARNTGSHHSDPCIWFGNIYPGEKPDMLNESELLIELSLPNSKVPLELKNAIKRGALNEDNDETCLSDVPLRRSLEKRLSVDNYKSKFKYLLYIEELKNEKDIKRYDIKSSHMNKRGNLFYLKVPGLAEKRPSVLRSDRVYVKSRNTHRQLGLHSYEGHVHHVEKDEVGLGFNKRLHESHITNQEYYVRFAFNRLPLKLMHRSTNLMDSCTDKEGILFPRNLTYSMPHQSLTMYNRLIEGNLQQKTAVENIVTGITSQVYIIYGPPGTGKTITMVEAIHQVLRKKTRSHMLVCAPSNSACDLLTSRLLKHADRREIYRMHAASRNWGEVPDDVKGVSNYQGKSFRYPSKTELMNHRILVTTLVTAGRLASAIFPKDHFDHVFIDEAGQAMEPETMIAVAGILSHRGKIVLAGDPKQLGPIIRSSIANEHGLGISYLERLMDTKEIKIYQKDHSGNYNPQCITKLLQNYRSHPAIINVPNENFYESELKVCADKLQRNYLSQWEGLPKKGFPVIFHGLQGEDKQESNSPSYFNPQEVKQVKKYVDQLLDIKGMKL